MDQQNIQTRNLRQNEKSDMKRMMELLQLCLTRWTWFVASVIIFLSAAFLYLQHKAPTYERSASILIKEDSKAGSSITSQLSDLGAMSGAFATNSNVLNELTTIATDASVLETVKRLHLDYQYTVKEALGLRNKVLYGINLPLSAELQGLNDNSGASFDMELQEDGTVRISKIRISSGGETTKYDGTYSGSLGSSIQTPAGDIVLTRNEACTEEAKENVTGKSIHVSRTGYISSVGVFKKKLTTAQDNKNNTIINLTYTDESIQRAEECLNTLISVYNESWIKDKNQIAVSTSEFINERLAIIEKELSGVDSDISTFQSENQIPDLESATNMYMNEASKANAQVLDLNNTLYMARYIRSFITSDANEFQLLPANSGLNDPTIENRISEYNEKLLQRNSILRNSSTANPMVQRLDANLQEMRSTIISSLDNLVASLNQQIASYRSMEAQNTAKLSKSPTQAEYLLSVERQQKVKESLYLFLLQKREENELSQAFTAYNTRVINPPSGSLQPVSPSKKKILLLALLAGLGLPLGIILLMDSLLDSKVRSKKDIQNLSIPYVGEIPMVGEGRSLLKRKKEDPAEPEYRIVVQERARDIANEAFRVVRTNLEFMLGRNNGCKVIMVTSANPGSGKTYLTANVAASFALKGLKVAVIDLDLRHASLSSIVGSPSKGVTEYLSNQIDSWNDILVPGKIHDNLDVIPVGQLPPNPTELLFTKKLDGMIQELRQSYDYVFIDSPPVEIVADADIIKKWADLTLFIIRANLFEKDILPEIENYYLDKKYANMAILLNATEVATGKYGSGRYGYGKYGYGNGYYYGSKTSKK